MERALSSRLQILCGACPGRIKSILTSLSGPCRVTRLNFSPPRVNGTSYPSRTPPPSCERSDQPFRLSNPEEPPGATGLKARSSSPDARTNAVPDHFHTDPSIPLRE